VVTDRKIIENIELYNLVALNFEKGLICFMSRHPEAMKRSLYWKKFEKLTEFIKENKLDAHRYFVSTFKHYVSYRVRWKFKKLTPRIVCSQRMQERFLNLGKDRAAGIGERVAAPRYSNDPVIEKKKMQEWTIEYVKQQERKIRANHTPENAELEINGDFFSHWKRMVFAAVGLIPPVVNERGQWLEEL